MILRIELSDKKWRNYLRAIGVQLLAVIIGIKPGFLWDIGPIPEMYQVEKVIQMINLCFTRKASLELFVLEINQDTCVCCTKLNTPVAVIDVSKHLKTPIFKEDQTNVVKKLNEKFENIKDGLSIDDQICIPTLVGFVLGYPILYWYDAASDGDTCLSGINLRVFQISFLENIVMSFSVPESLVGLKEVQIVLNDWEKNLSKGLISSFNRTLERVIL